jgi:hypothetical protein
MPLADDAGMISTRLQTLGHVIAVAIKAIEYWNAIAM